jgi:secreted Zn-dependent insulinase-like peptidase
MLARRLNYLHEDAQIDNILRMPYLYETFDSDGIKEYLSLLVPENMWVYYHSRSLDEEIKSHPEKFKREYYYSKDFTIEEMEDEFKEHLKKVMPEDGMRMGH